MLHPSVVVGISKKEGKGLFANSQIYTKEVIWELTPGLKVLTRQEKDRLPVEEQKFAFQYANGYIVEHDNSKYMNHSCNPNAWWDGDTKLTAKRNINKGEEITYDYSTADVGDWVASWTCECGYDKCRKQITGKDCLDKMFQSMYNKHIPSWTVDFIGRDS